MYIDGIGISGYRSFGGPIQHIGPFSKVNLFIGQNNSGKSNILLFLKYHYAETLQAFKQQNQILHFQSIDRPLKGSGEIWLSLPLFPDSDSWNAPFKILKEKGGNLKTLEKVFKSEIFYHKPDIPCLWLTVKGNFGENVALTVPQEHVSQIHEENVLTSNEWQFLFQKLFGGGGNAKHNWIPQTLEWFRYNVTYYETSISLIPAIRRVEQGKATENDDFSGLGLINRLSDLQNPDYNELEKGVLWVC